MSFVRNMVVAGILTKGDFGIASYFALTLSVLEMLSNMAVDKLLIQAEDGDDHRLQGAAHAYQFARGVIIGLVLLLTGGAVADLFGEPGTAWAFRALALLPLARGLMHLDVRRVQRGMRFGPNTWVYVVPQTLSALAAWPVAAWLSSYWAVLWLIIGQGVLMTLMTHLIAERPYRFAWDRELLGRIFRFGWPLILNGLLLLCVIHGDRLMIATFLSDEEMGVFSLALLMAMTPMTLLAKVLGDIMLPICSKPLMGADKQARYARMMRVYVMIALLMALGAIGLSGPVLLTLFGEKYVDAIVVLQWLGVANAVRVIRAGFVLQAVSQADTVTSMWSSAGRLAGLPLAAWAIYTGSGLGWIAAAAFAGELAATVPAMARLARRHRLSTLPLLPWMLGAGAVCVALVGALTLDLPLWLQAGATLVLCSLVGFVSLQTTNHFIKDEQGRWGGEDPDPVDAHLVEASVAV
jgi:O-antigen/teichoic acid export membrane protein